MLAAGLKGIEKGYELPEPVEEDIFEMSDEKRKKRGIDSLPGNLLEAIQITEEANWSERPWAITSSRSLSRTRRSNGISTRTHVSQFELERYLPIL